MLGHEKLIGNNWKRYPYDGSYYFTITMHVDTPEFEGVPIRGELRVSDHMVNPYTFSRESKPYKINSKNYAFGIAVTLPRYRRPLGSNEKGKNEAHVFQYISNNMSNSAVDKLKIFLEQYVNSMAIAEVGFGKTFSPNKYKEVSTEKPIFDLSHEDAEQERINRGRTLGAAALTPQNVVSNPPKQKNPKPTFKDLEYYMGELGMQPKIIRLNSKEGRRHQTINYNGVDYHAKELNGLWRPYNQKAHRFMGFNDGLYAWVNPEGKTVGAAIVKDRNLEPIKI
jgi:hypothetical protein